MADTKREAKLSKKMRGLVSFVLFLLIVLLSLTVCARACFLNRSAIEKQFTNYGYGSVLRDDVADYIKSTCMKQGISYENVDEIFSYTAVSNVVNSYYGYYISDKMEYSSDSYKKLIDKLCDEYKNDLKVQIAHSPYSYTEAAANRIIDDIRVYFTKTVEIPHIDKFKSVFNVLNIAMYAVIGVCTFFVLSLILIEYFIGTKRRRSVRAIGISFMSAGVYELFLTLIVYIVFQVKRVDVFPAYLAEQLLSYVYSSLAYVAACGGILLLISVAIMTFVWKMRKED